MPDTPDKLPKGALVVVAAKDGSGFYWEGKWRLRGKPRKLRLGRANLKLREKPLERLAGEDVDGWRLRYAPSKGRPSPPFDFLTPEQAKDAMRDLIAADFERAARVAAGIKDEVLTISAVADAWIKHRTTRGGGLRASTQRDYRSTLDAHIIGSEHFDKPVQKITTADVIAWQNALSARTEPRR